MTISSIFERPPDTYFAVNSGAAAVGYPFLESEAQLVVAVLQRKTHQINHIQAHPKQKMNTIQFQTVEGQFVLKMVFVHCAVKVTSPVTV